MMINVKEINLDDIRTLPNSAKIMKIHELNASKEIFKGLLEKEKDRLNSIGSDLAQLNDLMDVLLTVDEHNYMYNTQIQLNGYDITELNKTNWC